MNKLWSVDKDYEAVKDWDTKYLTHSVFHLFEDIKQLKVRNAELELAFQKLARMVQSEDDGSSYIEIETESAKVLFDDQERCRTLQAHNLGQQAKGVGLARGLVGSCYTYEYSSGQEENYYKLGSFTELENNLLKEAKAIKESK